MKAFLLGLAIFATAKLVFIFRFGNLSTFKSYSGDIPLMIFNSLRFDLQVLAYFLSPFLLLSFIALVSTSEKRIRFIHDFSAKIIPLFLSISLFILLVDQQFYSFFKLHFNPVVFDFFDEGPVLLLISMWHDHPVIRILLVSAGSYFLFRFLIKRIYAWTKLEIEKLNLLARILLSIILIGAYFLFARGSVGTFPLQNEDTIVSDSEFINACVPNPLFCLKEAYTESVKEFKIPAPEKVLDQFGYTRIEEAVADYRGIPVDSIKSNRINDLIFATSNGVQQKRYNVVLFIMESMSNHFIDFQGKECDLLGSFDKHFKEDIVFRNFQSYGNGTLISLENLLLNVPFQALFESKYRYISYDISIAKPFKDAGYRTHFVTGIELGWRHLNEVLGRQYFDNVYGKAHIIKNMPGAESNTTWGVFDHQVFDYLYKILSESGEPQFIVTLSSTNHTPYELPHDYYPYPIKGKVADCPLFSVSKERCLEVLTAFQYSNDALGKFMDKIKNSPLAENTIVIITGDHNIRSTICYNTQAMQKYKYSVPLYFYLPEDLKRELYIDTSRLGSHCDIMASVYPYILVNEKYINLGQDLFSPQIASDAYYSINEQQLLFGKSLTREEVEKKVNARKAILFYYYSSRIHENQKSERQSLKDSTLTY
ncbi:MAG: sulfatase-like hydrolase/transferase [Bacteroidales bacterium]|nr:sulfatase-like hydrolase/transferase [Bacteroidales bacterium]MCF8458839.1 sulfatase-like hydrolase/transferase [Bacteroidales bacterium]